MFGVECVDGNTPAFSLAQSEFVHIAGTSRRVTASVGPESQVLKAFGPMSLQAPVLEQTLTRSSAACGLLGCFLQPLVALLRLTSTMIERRLPQSTTRPLAPRVAYRALIKDLNFSCAGVLSSHRRDLRANTSGRVVAGLVRQDRNTDVRCRARISAILEDLTTHLTCPRLS